MDTYISSTCDKIQESMLKAYTFGIEDGNHGEIKCFSFVKQIYVELFMIVLIYVLISRNLSRAEQNSRLHKNHPEFEQIRAGLC